jgi:peptide/nickel transport system substrate-binding protein
VRKAASLAIDRKALSDADTLGASKANGNVVLNSMEYALPIEPDPYDPARAKKLLAEAGYPNGVDIVFNEGPPVVEPGLIQTDEAIAADMSKAGFRVKRNYIGDNTVVVARAKEGKLGPMFNWSWGYYSIFDADAILYDVFKCGETYSYYCNKALDDLIIQGRSTLDQKKRAEIYVKAQKLLFDDAAYVFKWGLRGVWGISNRVDYQAPADEVDRMFLVTPRKK